MNYAASDVAPHERYKILAAFVLPRPIAWVTTLDPRACECGALQLLQRFSEDPPLIMFAVNKRPDGRFEGHLAQHPAHRRVRGESTDEPLALAMHDSSGDFPPTSASLTIRPQARASMDNQGAAAG